MLLFLTFDYDQVLNIELTNMKNRLIFELTEEVTYITLTREFKGIFHYHFGENHVITGPILCIENQYNFFEKLRIAQGIHVSKPHNSYFVQIYIVLYTDYKSVESLRWYSTQPVFASSEYKK